MLLADWFNLSPDRYLSSPNHFYDYICNVLLNDLTYNEKELLQRIAGGDERAFNAVFDLYRDKLYFFLIRIVKSPEVAEEIITDIFMKLWIGHSMLYEIRDLESFLHKVAYNKAMSFFKVVSRHERLRQVYINQLDAGNIPTGEDILIDAECMRLLKEAVNALPPKRQQIYRLSREEGLTYEQIAERLQLSANTVRNSMVASNKSISQYLRKHQQKLPSIAWLFFIS